MEQKLDKKILVFSVFVVASCGIAYELIMSALSSYLLGDSILQFSTIIGVYLFAMGVGAGISKFIKDDKLIDNFINIEIAIGIIGGLSAFILMLVFFYFPLSFRVSLYGLVLSIGIMVGMEIPIVMRILFQNGQELKNMLSNVLSLDYLGALVVSLLFPMVFMPYLGIQKTAIIFGFSNLAIGLFGVYFISKENNKNKNLKYTVILLSNVLLGFLFVYAETITGYSEKKIYGDEVIYSKHTKYQKLLVTKYKSDVRLYINGNLQFSTKDEHRYHEALVLPIMLAHPNPKNVLILGGGDGLAAREILKHKGIEKVTLVDLDPAMTESFRTNELLKEINGNSLNNPNIKVVNQDASLWVESNEEFYDLVYVDFPDPSNYALGKLYTTKFYNLLKRRLSEKGLIAIQATSPYYAPNAYWTVYSTLKAVDMNVYPYHAYVPSFGDWGFFVVSKDKFNVPEVKEDDKYKFVDNKVMQELFVFPPDMKKLDLEPNNLNNQNLVERFNKDWSEAR